MINPAVRHIIEPELAEGEELLWADKPAKFSLSPKAKGVLFGSAFMMLFSVSVVPITETPIVFAAFFSLFLPFIAYAVLAPNLQVYGVTDKRIIIVNRILWGETISLSGDAITLWWSRRIESRNVTVGDIGTLLFNNQAPLPPIFENQMMPFPVFVLSKYLNIRGIKKQGLFNIRNSKQVKDLIPFNTLPWKG